MKKASVVYRAPSDGRMVEIKCASRKEAEAFAEMVRTVDPKAEPEVVEE